MGASKGAAMRICSFCFKEAPNTPEDVKKFPYVFCSPEHYNEFYAEKAKGPKTLAPCLWCGKMVLRFKWMIRKKKNFFCCPTHEGLWKSKNITGDKLYNFKGTGDRWSNYGSSWPYAKKLALERDKHTCRNCNKTNGEIGKEPDVHHTIPFNFFGLELHEYANDLDNLICLCPSCHTKRDAIIAAHIREIGEEAIKESIRVIVNLKNKMKNDGMHIEKVDNNLLGCYNTLYEIPFQSINAR